MHANRIRTIPYSMKKPIVIFLSTSLLLAIVFFTLPINVFDGVIEIEEPMRSYSLERPISLSYFVGLGYDPEDMVYVKDFYLTGKGITIAVIFILGLPALLSYRIYLKK